VRHHPLRGRPRRVQALRASPSRALRQRAGRPPLRLPPRAPRRLVTTAASTVPMTKERQPPGLALLFAVEMWERSSYYGMRALLILYLVDQHAGMGWPRPTAARVYGLYNMLVYLTPVAGGYLADRFIGTHRSMVIGGAIIAAGHFSMAVPTTPSFFLG